MKTKFILFGVFLLVLGNLLIISCAQQEQHIPVVTYNTLKSQRGNITEVTIQAETYEEFKLKFVQENLDLSNVIGIIPIYDGSKYTHLEEYKVLLKAN